MFIGISSCWSCPLQCPSVHQPLADQQIHHQVLLPHIALETSLVPASLQESTRLVVSLQEQVVNAMLKGILQSVSGSQY